MAKQLDSVLKLRLSSDEYRILTDNIVVDITAFFNIGLLTPVSKQPLANCFEDDKFDLCQCLSLILENLYLNSSDNLNCSIGVLRDIDRNFDSVRSQVDKQKV